MDKDRFIETFAATALAVLPHARVKTVLLEAEGAWNAVQAALPVQPNIEPNNVACVDASWVKFAIIDRGPLDTVVALFSNRGLAERASIGILGGEVVPVRAI